jgi:predicted PurR-regulated permease PerM
MGTEDKRLLGSLRENLRMSKPVRISYWVVAAAFIVVSWLQMTSAMLAVFFCYFAITKLHFTRNRWVAVALFVVLLSAIGYALVHFVWQSVVTFPAIAEKAVPSFIEWVKSWKWAQQWNLQLPFTDFDSLKKIILESIREHTNVGDFRAYAAFFKTFSVKVVAIIIGAVVAASIFLNSKLDLDEGRHLVTNNLYSLICRELSFRFRSLYQSFSTVMGAQLIISGINTTLTSIFIFAVKLPYAPLVIGVTFLCGLLPVVGNLISNTVIVGIAFTVSPQMALGALVFLVVIHKLEYFLNSKIIGDRIKNPVWLTLVGLIIGERLMGIPGMILAPVILNYIKVEMSRIAIQETSTS